MSRIFWMGVGAAGGIVVYRKTSQTVAGARERTLRENLTLVAQTASNVAASARYLASMSSPQEDATVVDIRRGAAGRT